MVGAAGTRRWLCVESMYSIHPFEVKCNTSKSETLPNLRHTNTLVQLGLHLFRPLSTCDAIREQTAQGLRTRVPIALNIAIVVYCDSGSSPNQQIRSFWHRLLSRQLTFLNYNIWSILLPLYNVSWGRCRHTCLH